MTDLKDALFIEKEEGREYTCPRCLQTTTVSNYPGQSGAYCSANCFWRHQEEKREARV